MTRLSINMSKLIANSKSKSFWLRMMLDKVVL